VEVVKTVLNALFILPIRIVLIFILVNIGAFFALVTHSSDARLLNKPGWRRSLRVFACNYFGLLLRHGFCFHSLTVIGAPMLDSGITCVSNHVSVLDILLLLELLTPVFVAKVGLQ
jgi:1-acyl-sn-glycerol-3-phosphate acyltransferase